MFFENQITDREKTKMVFSIVERFHKLKTQVISLKLNMTVINKTVQKKEGPHGENLDHVDESD